MEIKHKGGLQQDLAGGVAELRHVLDRLLALHRNLVEVLREEYSHMASLDVKGLGEAAHAKEVLLAEIINLEKIRIQAVERLGAALSLKTPVTLLSLAAALSGGEAEQLRHARTALNLLVLQAKELNAKNSDFAQSSLGRIDQMKKNVLGLNNNGSKETYSNSGVREPITEQGGRLLSTEA